jgi:hypothetical protein
MSENERELGKQTLLFGPDEFVALDSIPREPETKPIQSPVWTDNKARLIMHYLHYFVLLTKHGTYIDGFSGPQGECETDSWAAKLVLASEPRWIRHFHLCDESRSQVARLMELKNEQPTRGGKGRKLNRNIHIYHGDFNAKVDEILAGGTISEKEATFCLLDQRTFECQWKAIEKLAAYKKSGNKIEIFYFLANGWLERVKAWPIFERENGGAIMYYMIHATDHPEAPKFMSRAYRRAVLPLEPIEQLTLDLFNELDNSAEQAAENEIPVVSR